MEAGRLPEVMWRLNQLLSDLRINFTTIQTTASKTIVHNVVHITSIVSGLILLGFKICLKSSVCLILFDSSVSYFRSLSLDSFILIVIYNGQIIKRFSLIASRTKLPEL